MSARSKKASKSQKRRKELKRKVEKRKRRQVSAANDGLLSETDPALVAEGNSERGEIDRHELEIDSHGFEIDDREPLLPNTRHFVDALLDELDQDPPEQSPIRRREETEVDIWWGKFSQAGGVARMQMTREKLSAVSTEDEEYEQFFPEAIHELESKLSPQDYVAFLEDLLDNHREAFWLSGDWHTWTMACEYLAQKRLDDVDRATLLFADELKEIGTPFFSLMSTLRLAGRADACQALIDAAVNKLAVSQLLPWAVDEILEWAMFANYERCAANGVTDEALEALHAAARGLDINDDEEARARRREFALHLAGKSGKEWSRKELVNNREAWRNIDLLGVDYQRWLCQERALKPIVADEFRRLVFGAIDGIDCSFRRLLMGLPRDEFDHCVADKLGFMSLDRVHAPATIIAMKHYYEFLLSVDLVKAGPCRGSQSVCDRLWEQLKRAAPDSEWRTFTFLEDYLP